MDIGDIVSLIRPKVGFRANRECLIVPVNVGVGTQGRIVYFDPDDLSGYIETQDGTSIDFYTDEVQVVSTIN